MAPLGERETTGPLTLGDMVARSGLPHLEARILLGFVLNRTRAELITASAEPVSELHRSSFCSLAARRKLGEPIAYLVGRREFYSRDFKVSADVLIPRPETELLVERALGSLKTLKRPRILDLGTGSGAIAITLALEHEGASVTGVDRSAAALRCARKNAESLEADVRWIESDWYRALGVESFDLIVSNPPYVALDDPHLQEGDVRFEPKMALAAESNGLRALWAVIDGAFSHLKPRGTLLVEHGFDQASRVRTRLAESGFLEIASWVDLAGIERVSGGIRPG
jgi:release factor glutamine methyltransferase